MGVLDGVGTPTLLELPLEVYNDSSLLEDVLRTSAKKAPLIQFWRGSEMLELAFVRRKGITSSCKPFWLTQLVL